MAEKLESIQLALFERLVDVGRLLGRRTDCVTRKHVGIKETQYGILIRLRNEGGELRMADLADKLVSTPSGLTYQLSLLEQKGLAERVVAPDDDRGILARITDQGRQLLLEVAQEQSDMILMSVVKPFSPSEVEELHRMLGILQINLRGEETGGMLPEQAPPPKPEGSAA
jgi:DNA-binding MarR family transcriptional regulator